MPKAYAGILADDLCAHMRFDLVLLRAFLRHLWSDGARVQDVVSPLKAGRDGSGVGIHGIFAVSFQRLNLA